MFNILSSAKIHIGDVFWRRSASYKNKSYNISAVESSSNITFSGNVRGTEIYDVEIIINKPSGSLRCSCDCLAFDRSHRCKHIGGFARKIREDYVIYDPISLVSPQLELHTPSSTDKSGLSISPNPIQEYKINPSFLSDFPDELDPNDPETMNFLLKHYPEFLIKKSSLVHSANTSSSLSLLSHLSESSIPNQHTEIGIRIKLEILTNSHKDRNNLFITLYQSKIQKNGKLSVGKKLYKNDISASSYQKYTPFLEEKNNNYYGWGGSNDNSRLNFKNAPEFFIQLLTDITEPLSDMDNHAIFIQREMHSLHIEVRKNIDKNETKFAISLVIQVDGKEHEKIILRKQKLFYANRSPYFGFIDTNHSLGFFQTTLPSSFIFSLCENELILNQEEWNIFRSNPEFEILLEHTDDIGFIEDDIIMGIPGLQLEIEIDPEFKSIITRYEFLYDSITIHPKNPKNYFLSKKQLIKRDLEKEKVEIDTIQELIRQANEYNTESCSLTKMIDENSDLFFDTIVSLIESGIKVEYKQTTKRISSSTLSAKIAVNSGEDWFDMNVTFSIGDREIEQSREILRAMKQGGNYITLDNGTVILLKQDITKTLKEWDELGITEKNIDETIRIGKYAIGLMRTKSKNEFSDFTLSKEIIELKKSLENFSGIKQYPLPKDATVTLRDYQRQGYNWLRFLQEYNFSGILADDMGLGKTIQTLVFLQHEHDKKGTKSPTLIVVPTSLVLNWMDEALKFVPKLKIQYIKDGKTGFSDIFPDTQIIIVSYGIIANLIEEPDFEKKKFHYVILDEAQNIKNLATARTKSILKLKASHRLALSGTPIENNLMELYSIFNFLMPGFIGTESSFREKYTKGDPDSLEIFSRKVKPFILRRKKEEVLKDLPAKQEEIIHLEMGQKQKDFYTALKTTYKAQISKQITENGLAKSQFAVLDALLKLRQACLMPRLVKIDGNMLDESIKLEYIEENIEEMINAGHNLLIFSQFTGFLAFVRQILDKKGIPYNYLDGSTKREDRKKLVDHFNSGGVPVFLISLKAGGTGLNLTRADYVIHLDPWWNPAVENQATDRAHRMGQEKTVFVQKLIVRDTVEEKILKLQEKKKKLIDDLFSGDFKGSLSEEDIGYIFE